jgi:hypothetical protein
VIIKFLTNESVDAHEIHARLNAEFGEKTHAMRTIEFWMIEIQRGREDLHNEARFRSPAFDYITKNTISLLEKAPFDLHVQLPSS